MVVVVVTCLNGAVSTAAQTPVPLEVQAPVPFASHVQTVIPVSGQIRTSTGEVRTGPVALIVSLYDGKDDVAPRWIEVERATLDAAGSYSIQFGASRQDGLPADLFTGPAGVRWIGVAVEGEPEQGRVALISVPYATRAAVADTLAGRAATDFVLKEGVRGAPDGEERATTRAVAGGLGFLQKGDGAGGTVDSAAFETGGNVGIGMTNPGDRIHVTGGGFRSTNGPDNTVTFVRSHPSIAGSEIGTLSAAPFWFITSGVERVRIATGGNVGIGTNDPTRGKLDLNQALGGAIGLYVGVPTGAVATAPAVRVQGYSPSVELLNRDNTQNWYFGIDDNDGKKFKIGRGYGPNQGLFAMSIDAADNVVFRTNVVALGNLAAKYQDVAEWVDSAEQLEAGTLVVIDSTSTNRVMASRTPYDGRVAGAVSPQPGIILGEEAPGRVLVAQSGRVKVKADARNGAIRPGDLLVSSPTPGHVMRSRAVEIGGTSVHRPGTVVGKALEALSNGTGEILVLLTLQ